MVSVRRNTRDSIQSEPSTEASLVLRHVFANHLGKSLVIDSNVGRNELSRNVHVDSGSRGDAKRLENILYHYDTYSLVVTRALQA